MHKAITLAADISLIRLIKSGRLAQGRPIPSELTRKINSSNDELPVNKLIIVLGQSQLLLLNMSDL